MKTRAFEVALEEADSLLKLSKEEVLKTCIYSNDFIKATKPKDTSHIKTDRTKRTKPPVQMLSHDELDLKKLKSLLSSDKFKFLIQSNFERVTKSEGLSPQIITTNLSIRKRRPKKKDKILQSDSMLQQKDEHSMDQSCNKLQEKWPLAKVGQNNSKLQPPKNSELPHATESRNSDLPHMNNVLEPNNSASGMNDILEAEEEAQREFEMIETMLSLVQDSSGSTGSLMGIMSGGSDELHQTSMSKKKESEEGNRNAVNEMVGEGERGMDCPQSVDNSMEIDGQSSGTDGQSGGTDGQNGGTDGQSGSTDGQSGGTADGQSGGTDGQSGGTDGQSGGTAVNDEAWMSLMNSIDTLDGKKHQGKLIKSIQVELGLHFN